MVARALALLFLALALLAQPCEAAAGPADEILREAASVPAPRGGPPPGAPTAIASTALRPQRRLARRPARIPRPASSDLARRNGIGADLRR